MADTKKIAVRFPSGREVLNAYWGFLSNGGIVIANPVGKESLEEGDPVAVDVTIESSKTRYLLAGHVVRRPHLAASDSAVIAFEPGEPQDLLLSAAWADTDNVPARRLRRYPLSLGAELVRASGETVDGRLVNVSGGGYCLRVLARAAAPAFFLGEVVRLRLAGREYGGVVRWTHSADLGVEFIDVDEEERQSLVARLVAHAHAGSSLSGSPA